MIIFFPASFYGSSFVSLPLQDAKSSTYISFKFRTSRPESLLFLVAGKTDYCLIMLQQGIVKVIKYLFFCQITEFDQSLQTHDWVHLANS